MGVHLTPIIRKEVVTLDALRGRRFAVDGNNVLYQFLALIRQPDGRPLTSREGIVTSHLVGLLYRTTRLLADYRMSLVFVFDGRPPRRKGRTLEARREARRKATQAYEEALAAGDLATAWSKAVTSTRLTKDLIRDARRLLEGLGIPWVQAPAEGEAQAAWMCAQGDVWAAASRDYDALLYGSPVLVRYLTISGREFLPSRGTSRPLEPEVIALEDLLRALRLTREQLVDLALLVGTDYNEGVKGVGPRKALDLMRAHGRLEELPSEVRDRLPSDLDALRDLFLHPLVKEVRLPSAALDRRAVVDFLCGERDFSQPRVEAALDRLERSLRQPSLDEF